jgi:indolepyruvate ferredoxin oxidoreductase alpha subunit
MVTDDKVGKVELLMGNHAVVRGAIEVGVSVATTYPGTPASEIGDLFSEIAKRAGIYFEYSTNEKVAFETALAASWAGLRSIVSMKHVGLNVAADALLSSTYGGTEGGMVIAVGDDPSCYSSQNEQDSRYYARFASIPCLEPCSPQESKDMTKYAFTLSEKFKLPVLLRHTTRTAHCSGNVEFGEIVKEKKSPSFTKDKVRKAVLPAHAYKLHPDLIKRFAELSAEIENAPFNSLELHGDIGIIACGISVNYIKEALNYEGINDVSILKLGITHPLPLSMIKRLLNSCDKILVVEELEPLVETEVKKIALDMGKNVKIYGKDLLPRTYEFTTGIVHSAIVKFLNIKPEDNFSGKAVPLEIIPPRYPVLCPGCPHRATFYAIRRAFPKGIYPSDIGCYTLGIQPPLNAVDTCLCMGASIGIGAALSKFLPEKIVATIGDSTFFHAGLSSLANAVYNGSKATIILMDNRITAMTGQQPCPSCGVSSLGEPETPILPERIAEAMGVKYVRIVDPINLKETIEVFKEAASLDETAFIVARHICALIDTNKYVQVKVDPNMCNGCKICVKAFGCPALIWVDNDKKVIIDDSLCNGCGVCIEVCPKKAILRKE